MKNPQAKLIITIILVAFIIFDVVLAVKLLFAGHTALLLSPKGTIAAYENRFITILVSIMLVVATVTVLTGLFIAWKYRATNTKIKHEPDTTGSVGFKFSLWLILTSIIAVLSVFIWIGAHTVDPFKPINAAAKPMIIQVVALDWKWLFIYPQQNIATVNFLEFPVKTPVTFELTADAPMNSFWIPQLGSQMFAMPGMENQLHLIANQQGEYPGTDVEINGDGYAKMRFMAKATYQADFDAWVQKIQRSSHPLDSATYSTLAKPSEDTPVRYFAPVEKRLFSDIIMKYMMPIPSPTVSSIKDMKNMNMTNMKGM